MSHWLSPHTLNHVRTLGFRRPPEVSPDVVVGNRARGRDHISPRIVGKQHTVSRSASSLSYMKKLFSLALGVGVSL